MIKIENIVRPNILELQPYSSARDEFSGKEGVFLDANENPFGTLNRYPDPYQKELKQKLAEQKGVANNTIFVGNGSDEVIDLAFRIFCRPGIDKALIFSPTYGMYDVSASINNVALIKLPLNKDFQLDLEKIKPYLSDNNIKLIFICSPNNPTGNLINKADIEFILNNFNGIVMIDEAYIDFSNEASWISKLENYPNLIVTQTLSKAYAMAGIRLGICYASTEIIKVLNTIKPPYNINELTQKKAIELLSIKDLASNQIKDILKERSSLISELKTIKYVSKIYSSDANFVLVKVDDANLRYNQLIEKGIVIRNRTTQPGCENTLRLTVGSPEENKILIKALTDLSGL